MAGWLAIAWLRPSGSVVLSLAQPFRSTKLMAVVAAGSGVRRDGRRNNEAYEE